MRAQHIYLAQEVTYPASTLATGWDFLVVPLDISFSFAVNWNTKAIYCLTQSHIEPGLLLRVQAAYFRFLYFRAISFLTSYSTLHRK